MIKLESELHQQALAEIYAKQAEILSARAVPEPRVEQVIQTHNSKLFVTFLLQCMSVQEQIEEKVISGTTALEQEQEKNFWDLFIQQQKDFLHTLGNLIGLSTETIDAILRSQRQKAN